MAASDAIRSMLGIEIPIIQAPMAGAQDWELAAAVAKAGGLGSLPCAMLSPDQVHEQVGHIRAQTDRPFNLNFFCHRPMRDEQLEQRWQERLRPYYQELGLPVPAPAAGGRDAFGEELCRVVEELRPPVVSFHFGLPARDLVGRVRATGAVVLSTANSVAEARWLEQQGVDAVIAQGMEAGGHQGLFLEQDVNDVSGQLGTFALVPQVVDAVRVPVIAAGGVADGRTIAAAMALGASAVQVGTAYLLSPESRISPLHRAALERATSGSDRTVLTNVFTGRPARSIANRLIREVGPISRDAPPFPGAAAYLGPLRSEAEAKGSADFSPLWAGQAAPFARAMPAGELTRRLWDEALPQGAR